jgi:A/G-specific adenine glycosylase
MALAASELKRLQRRLLRWFARHRRDMPWRRTQDPYAVWVCEVMLQQTQVATVRDYFARFMRRFPNVRSLARAPRDEVLKAWEGLGYYARARNLHNAAIAVVRQHAGRLPRSVEALRRLPGIGPYTAGAVASIAFGLDEPVLDGNVTRVLSRLFCVRGGPWQPRVRRRLWRLARRLIPPGRAGVFNQALMDLGATVCVPRRPRCEACPVEPLCLARARGEEGRLPRRRKRGRLPHHTIVAGVIRRRGRILIDRRPADGLLGGLWELPGGKVEAGETLAAALRREVREEVGLSVRVGRPVATVKHAYTHFRITLHAFECVAAAGRARAIACEEVRWVRPGELRRFAFPRANQKILAALGA